MIVKYLYQFIRLRNFLNCGGKYRVSRRNDYIYARSYNSSESPTAASRAVYEHCTIKLPSDNIDSIIY